MEGKTIKLDGTKGNVTYTNSVMEPKFSFMGAENIQVMTIETNGVITFNPDIEQTEAAQKILDIIQELNKPYVQRLLKAEEALQKACDLLMEVWEWNTEEDSRAAGDFVNKHNKW